MDILKTIENPQKINVKYVPKTKELGQNCSGVLVQEDSLVIVVSVLFRIHNLKTWELNKTTIFSPNLLLNSAKQSFIWGHANVEVVYLLELH